MHVKGVDFYLSSVLLPIYLHHLLEQYASNEALCAIDVLAYQTKQGGSMCLVDFKPTILDGLGDELMAVEFVVVVLNLVVVFPPNVLLCIVQYHRSAY